MNAAKPANYAKVKAQELQDKLKIRSEGFMHSTTRYIGKTSFEKRGDE
ncbi:MAG: hypothetical protein WDZ91_10640 [Paenibacillaceae bacterium]